MLAQVSNLKKKTISNKQEGTVNITYMKWGNILPDYIFIYWPCCVAHRILIPHEVWSLNHWIAKEVPDYYFYTFIIYGQEDPLEEEMATHSSILAWKIPWKEEPGGLQYWGEKSEHTSVWTVLLKLRCFHGI